MTQSLEDYVETVYLLVAEGRPAKVSDIASAMSVTKPSVVKAIRELIRLGLVDHRPYADIELTAKGRRVAGLVRRRHRLLRDFLTKLGVSERNADRDACLMEHILSAETLERIRIYTEKKT